MASCFFLCNFVKSPHCFDKTLSQPVGWNEPVCWLNVFRIKGALGEARIDSQNWQLPLAFGPFPWPTQCDWLKHSEFSANIFKIRRFTWQKIPNSGNLMMWRSGNCDHAQHLCIATFTFWEEAASRLRAHLSSFRDSACLKSPSRPAFSFV